MKNLLSVFMLAVLFVFTTAFALSKRSQLEGNWSGEFMGTAKAAQFQTHFWTENGEVKGTIDFPQENIFGLELSWIIVESPTVHFEVVKNSETLAFDGRLIENKLFGEFSTKTGRGIFDLSRIS